jgi:4-hydroxy-4-methyl-2-oxoglutarate aldolase
MLKSLTTIKYLQLISFYNQKAGKIMSEIKNHISRRIFLGLGGALAAVSGISASAAGKKTIQAPPPVISDISVSLIADALRKIGQDPRKLVMTTDIKPLVNIGKTVIGPAITCKWELARGKGSADDIRRYVFKPLDNAAPGSMWVIASGTTQILSMFGDVIARACVRNGLAGAVTDSGCRDIEAMKEIGFSVSGKASVPYGPGNIIRPVAANVPVICGKIEVHPGDLVASDSDGVIVIPKAVIAELKESVKKKATHENNMRRKIDEGHSLEKTYSL